VEENLIEYIYTHKLHCIDLFAVKFRAKLQGTLGYLKKKGELHKHFRDLFEEKELVES
jgi:hypothetical protein